jgi:hypothetical protein
MKATYPRIVHDDRYSAMFAEMHVSKAKRYPITEVLDGKHDVPANWKRLCRQFLNIHFPGWGKTKEKA